MSPPLSLSSRVRHHLDVAWRIVEGEAFIITTRDSRIHTLNPVATRLWELFAEPREVGLAVDVLCAEFEVERHTAERDTLELSAGLLERGMLEHV